jgi:hypothetical protein
MGEAGVRALLLLIVALGFAACAQPGYTYRELDDIARDGQRDAIEQASDACGAAQHQSLIGRDGASIQQSELPPVARVVCHNCPVTMDHRPDRLNVLLGPDGKVESLRCG